MAKKNRDDLTSIYVIARANDDGFSAPCKIGIATDPAARVAAINTSCPFRVELFYRLGQWPRSYMRQLEDCFHSCQKAHRLNGEWFDMEPSKAASLLSIYIFWLLRESGSDDAEGIVERAAWRADDDSARPNC